QQVHVAPVVEVGGHEGDGVDGGRRDAGLRAHVLEMAAAVVLQQARGRAREAVGEGGAPRRGRGGVGETGEDDVEVAVGVRVHEGRGDVWPGIGGNARRGGRVGEPPAV